MKKNKEIEKYLSNEKKHIHDLDGWQQCIKCQRNNMKNYPKYRKEQDTKIKGLLVDLLAKVVGDIHYGEVTIKLTEAYKLVGKKSHK